MGWINFREIISICEILNPQNYYGTLFNTHQSGHIYNNVISSLAFPKSFDMYQLISLPALTHVVEVEEHALLNVICSEEVSMQEKLIT